MQRVMVVGCAGAGKSTVAGIVGQRLGLPVVHLDQHYWAASWVEPDEATWRQRQRALVAGARWVIDGNYSHGGRGTPRSGPTPSSSWICPGRCAFCGCCAGGLLARAGATRHDRRLPGADRPAVPALHLVLPATKPPQVAGRHRGARRID
ncbi:MAG: hypothetical protein WKF47_15355 [Geodermatophilaceae bacterium]